MESQYIALDLSKIPDGTIVKRDGIGFVGVPTDNLNENESGSGSGSGGSGSTSASAWLTGSTVPASSLGEELDFYLRSNGYLYQKVGAGWLLLAQLKGETGAAGAVGSQGVAGADGDDGLNGWTPVLAVATDGERRVLRVVDWTGGSGTKPAAGSYVGAAGYVANMADAVNIRGAAGSGGGEAAGLAIASSGVNETEKQLLVLNGVSIYQSLGLRAFGSAEVFEFHADISENDLRDGILGLNAIASLPLPPTLTVSGTSEGTTEIESSRALEFGEYQNVPQLEIRSGCVDVFQSTAAAFAVNGGEPMGAGVSEADFQANQRALGGSFAEVVCKGESSLESTSFTLYFPYDATPAEPFCTETDSTIERLQIADDPNRPLYLITTIEGSNAEGRAGLVTPIQARNLESLQNPIDGFAPIYGADGTEVGYLTLTGGWMPSLAIESDGERRVVKVAGWFGGIGTSPFPPDIYLGENGYVADIAEAVDIRGGAGAGGGETPLTNALAGKTAQGISTGQDYSELTDGNNATSITFGYFEENEIGFEFESTVLVQKVRLFIASGGPMTVRVVEDVSAAVFGSVEVLSGTENEWVEIDFEPAKQFGPSEPMVIQLDGNNTVISEIQAHARVWGGGGSGEFHGALVTQDGGSLTVEGGLVPFPFSTVVWDEGGYYEPTVPTQLTVPENGEGYYLMSSSVNFSLATPYTGFGGIILQVRRADETVSYLGSDAAEYTSATVLSANICVPFYLNAGDCVSVVANFGSETAITTLEGGVANFFSMVKLESSGLSAGGAVASVNGETGAVVLNGANIEAIDPQDAAYKPINDIIYSYVMGSASTSEAINNLVNSLPATIAQGVVDYIENTFIGGDSDLQAVDGNAIIRPTGTAAGTFTNPTITTNLKGQITAIESRPNVLSAKTLELTTSVALDFEDLAQYLHVTGTLSGATYIELPTPSTEPYALHIRNATTGGDLYVQKLGGADATQIQSGQTMIVMVTV